MRIAIDARTTAVSSGVGRYVTKLVASLAQIDPQNEYFVFAPQATHSRFDDLEQNERFHLVPVENSIGDQIWEWLHFPRMLRNRGIDLLHSAAFTFPTTVSCATVVTIHDLFFLEFPEFYLDSERAYLTDWTRISVEKADLVITVSDSTKDKCTSMYEVPPDRFVTIHEAAGQEFCLRDDWTSDKKILGEKYGITVPYLLHVGELGGRKNIARLVGALAQGWQQQFFDHTLVLAGSDHWSSAPLIRQIAELGVDERVKRLGYVPNRHLPALYRGADLLACVSLDEGFGLPAVEGMCCGTPLVVSDRPCFHETCGSRGAVFVDPLDEHSILRGIKKVLQDDGLRDRLRANGLSRGSRFDWLITAKQTLSAYETAFNRHNQAIACERLA